MKHLYLYITIFFLSGSILIGGGLYIIQSVVCQQMQDIMRNSGNYNVFTGCTLTVENEPQPIEGIKEGGKL